MNNNDKQFKKLKRAKLARLEININTGLSPQKTDWHETFIGKNIVKIIIGVIVVILGAFALKSLNRYINPESPMPQSQQQPKLQTHLNQTSQSLSPPRKEKEINAPSPVKKYKSKEEKPNPEQHGGIIIKGNTFINNKTGISAPSDANIKMDDNSFEGNEKSIDIRDK